MSEPVAELRYSGEIYVRPYRRGTYLGAKHLEELIEETLGDRYRFGEGWQGTAVISIQLHERPAGVRAVPSNTVVP